jgi:hypothetical protein
MVLEQDDILKLIKEPSNPNIKDWREDHAALDLFVNGGDVSKALEKIKNYENKDQKELRDKIAKSTKDLLSYLLNPINKVFSANGFKSEIELSQESFTEKFNEHLEKLPDGVSLTKWMQDYWAEAFITDPNGIILIKKTNNDNPVPYPTYKSINKVHDYKFQWNKFEYIILLFKEVMIEKEKTQIYRVIDDETDSLWYVKKDKLFQYEDDENVHFTTHGFDMPPALLPSNIIDKKTGGRKSFIEKIDETLMEYMRDSSVHSIYKFLHGFPIFWAYATKCTTCNGTGRVKNPREGEDPTMVCPTCKGKRLQVTRDVSDGVRLPIPKDGDPIIGGDIAGFVSPDLETWEKQLEEMHLQKENMFYTLWGTKLVADDKTEKTATEVYVNVQPMNETLNSISDAAEQVHSDIASMMAKSMYPSESNTTKVFYGRRYMIETPDMLWKRYAKAKEEQAPISVLDYMYEEFLMAEYHNDQKMLDQMLKEFCIEPFPHYSLSDLSGVASKEQLQKKIIYSQWSTSGVDFMKEVEVLKEEFEEYFKKHKQLENEEVTEV